MALPMEVPTIIQGDDLLVPTALVLADNIVLASISYAAGVMY